MIVRAGVGVHDGAGGPGGGGGEERQAGPGGVLPPSQAVTGVAVGRRRRAGYAQMIDPETDERDRRGRTADDRDRTGTTSAAARSTVREGKPADRTGRGRDRRGDRDEARPVGRRRRSRSCSQGRRGSSRSRASSGFGETDNLAGATLAALRHRDGAARARQGRRRSTRSRRGRRRQRRRRPAPRRDRRPCCPTASRPSRSRDVADEQSKAAEGGARVLPDRAARLRRSSRCSSGAFIIFNTFSIIVAQRTRELALLRALGASRRQVMASVVVEAVVVGLFAAVDRGSSPGIGIAVGLKALLGAFGIDLPSTALQLQPAHDHRVARRRLGRDGRRLDPAGAQGRARGADPGAPRVGRHRAVLGHDAPSADRRDRRHGARASPRCSTGCSAPPPTRAPWSGSAPP